jgi:hypothetical protein
MQADKFRNMTAARMLQQEITLAGKGNTYSAEGDRLYNFYAGAAELGISPEQYLFTLVTKHLVTIRVMVKNVETEGTPPDKWIDEYLGDVINYMLLLEGLLRDRREREEQDGRLSREEAPQTTSDLLRGLRDHLKGLAVENSPQWGAGRPGAATPVRKDEC